MHSNHAKKGDGMSEGNVTCTPPAYLLHILLLELKGTTQFTHEPSNTGKKIFILTVLTVSHENEIKFFWLCRMSLAATNNKKPTTCFHCLSEAKTLLMIDDLQQIEKGYAFVSLKDFFQ